MYANYIVFMALSVKTTIKKEEAVSVLYVANAKKNDSGRWQPHSLSEHNPCLRHYRFINWLPKMQIPNAKFKCIEFQSISI